MIFRSIVLELPSKGQDVTLSQIDFETRFIQHHERDQHLVRIVSRLSPLTQSRGFTFIAAITAQGKAFF